MANLNNSVRRTRISYSPEDVLQPMYQFLSSSTDGKTVLKDYELNGQLCKNSRNLMSRLIIAELKDRAFSNVVVGGNPDHLRKFTIKRQKFEEIAGLIIRLFKNENTKTFYSPFVYVNKMRIGPSGTLYEHFNYTKGKLRRSQLLGVQHAIINNDLQSVEVSDTEKLDWLKNHLEPESKVFEYWNATFDKRRDLLKNNIPVHEYYQLFPALGIDQGVNLLKADFDKLWPEKDTTFSNRWKIIRNFLISQITAARNIREISDGGLVHLLSTVLEHNQDTIIICLLPYLIEVSRKRRIDEGEASQGNRNWIRTSVQERKNSLFIHVQSASDINTKIDQRRNELRTTGSTLQPIIIFVGPIQAIEAVYVAVNDILYKVHSSLHAVQLAFWIYMTVDCAYPESAATIWLFFQKACFDIHLRCDKSNRSLNTLIGHLEALL